MIPLLLSLVLAGELVPPLSPPPVYEEPQQGECSVLKVAPGDPPSQEALQCLGLLVPVSVYRHLAAQEDDARYVRRRWEVDLATATEAAVVWEDRWRREHEHATELEATRERQIRRARGDGMARGLIAGGAVGALAALALAALL